MRLIYFITALVISMTHCVAQAPWAKGLLTGGVAFDSRTNKSANSSQRYSSPDFRISYGHLINEHWQIGIESMYRYKKVTNEFASNQDISKLNEYSITPFARYFFHLKAIHLYVGGGIKYHKLQTNEAYNYANNNVADYTNRYFRTEFMAGGIYMITSKLGLQVETRSDIFPFSLSGLTTGLVYAIGGNSNITSATTQNYASQKGGIAVGFGFSNSFNKTNTTNTNYNNTANNSNISYNANLGVFVSDNNLLGVNIVRSYSSNYFSTNNATNRDITAQGWRISPFYERYFSQNKIKPFLIFMGKYDAYSSKNYKTISLGVGIGTGVAYMAGKNWIIKGLLGEISYDRNSNSEDKDMNFHRVGANIGLTPTITVQYVFRKKTPD